jgi:hypothetical protein
MNHLLHQISWHQYLTVTCLSAMIFYLAIILHRYRPELQNLQGRITGDKPNDHLRALQYEPPEEEITAPPVQAPVKIRNSGK